MCLFSDDYIRPGVSLQVKQNGGYGIFCYAACCENLSFDKVLWICNKFTGNLDPRLNFGNS
jgi:hypothetical protein